MAATATIRELRNQFPKIRQLVDREGEVVVTEQGTPKYRLTRYTPPRRKKVPLSKDYMARLRRHQPRALSAAMSRALRDANRGER
jgi:antitoxin (DNA-binding transcriptional repressor) of toxin-antitoxin stability system